MADWTKTMTQTYEYYTVDPATWKDKSLITNVTSCTISRDSEADTLGSASFEITESLGECYIRVYLVTLQNGITERHPLGTYLIQTPSTSFDGKVQTISMDAYTPLLELKEALPPLGYSISKNENIMSMAYKICREYARAPVTETTCDKTIFDDFVADPSENWLSFLIALMANAKYEFNLDELGRILFSPVQDTKSLQPFWTFTDDNSSILYPELSVKHDLYGIPNFVEVVYSNNDHNYYATATNDDPNSPISTVNRGRIIPHRVTNPDLIGDPTENQIQEYATQLLREMSTLEYTLSYSHGYCPVRVGDCVRLNYAKAGINNVKAKVISQSIKCTSGCQVTEKAVFTDKLWKG